MMIITLLAAAAAAGAESTEQEADKAVPAPAATVGGSDSCQAPRDSFVNERHCPDHGVLLHSEYCTITKYYEHKSILPNTT